MSDEAVKIPEEFRLDEEKARELLLTSDGELSNALEGILRCLFARFTQPNTAMTRKQLIDYSRACNNGNPFSEEEIEEIQEHFECDDNKCLTLTGFLQLYHTQTNGDVLETWKDVVQFGYASSILSGTASDAHSNCLVCAKPGRFSCKQCLSARYCSPVCQKVDWKRQHKAQCRKK